MIAIRIKVTRACQWALVAYNSHDRELIKRQLLWWDPWMSRDLYQQPKHPH